MLQRGAEGGSDEGPITQSLWRGGKKHKWPKTSAFDFKMLLQTWFP